jgi:hypothetical protein
MLTRHVDFLFAPKTTTLWYLPPWLSTFSD